MVAYPVGDDGSYHDELGEIWMDVRKIINAHNGDDDIVLQKMRK